MTILELEQLGVINSKRLIKTEEVKYLICGLMNMLGGPLVSIFLVWQWMHTRNLDVLLLQHPILTGGILLGPTYILVFISWIVVFHNREQATAFIEQHHPLSPILFPFHTGCVIVARMIVIIIGRLILRDYTWKWDADEYYVFWSAKWMWKSRSDYE
jgi:hypothetical protein